MQTLVKMFSFFSSSVFLLSSNGVTASNEKESSDLVIFFSPLYSIRLEN